MAIAGIKGHSEKVLSRQKPNEFNDTYLDSTFPDEIVSLIKHIVTASSESRDGNFDSCWSWQHFVDPTITTYSALQDASAVMPQNTTEMDTKTLTWEETVKAQSWSSERRPVHDPSRFGPNLHSVRNNVSRKSQFIGNFKRTLKSRHKRVFCTFFHILYS